MKKIKLLTPIVALGMLTVPLAGCSKDKTQTCTIEFRCSEGITLSSTKSISVAVGTTWQQLVARQLVPEVTVPSNYTEFGWCVLDEQGNWQEIIPGYEVKSNIQVKYIGFSNEDHPAINVNINYIPGESVDLKFASGFTWKQFRTYYDIPAEPTAEGVNFLGYYKVTQSTNETLTKIEDDYVFGYEQTNIRMVWEYKTITVNFSTDGKGTVTPATKEIKYGDKWGDVKTGIDPTPIDPDKYEFDQWVNENGERILDSEEITTDGFKAIACFKDVVYHTIHFTASSGVTLTGSLQIQARDGIKWSELQAKGLIPTVTTGLTTKVGWVAIDEKGGYEVIDDNYVVKSGLEARYVAYDKPSTAKTVNFKYAPGPDAKWEELTFVQGGTFGEFRELYSIPQYPSFEGYTFTGYYIVPGSEEPINDTYTFDSTSDPISIEARYEQITLDITFRNDGHGTTSVSALAVPYGTKWSDVAGEVTVTPEYGYSFKEWVDQDGFTISPDFVIKANLTATATFRPGKITITMLSEKARSVGYTQQNNHCKDIKYSDTNPGTMVGKMGFQTPKFENNNYYLRSDVNSSDTRFLCETFKIGIAVPPNTKKKTALNVQGFIHLSIGSHILRNHANAVLQIHKLEDENDNPSFFAWPEKPSDTRPFDPRCQYKEVLYDQKTSWASHWDTQLNFNTDAMVFEDNNTTDQIKIFTHYIAIAFLHSGWDASKHSDQWSELSIDINLIDK